MFDGNVPIGVRGEGPRRGGGGEREKDGKWEERTEEGEEDKIWVT